MPLKNDDFVLKNGHLFCNSKVFGAVFAYLWYLQLSDVPVADSLLELVYAVRSPINTRARIELKMLWNYLLTD